MTYLLSSALIIAVMLCLLSEALKNEHDGTVALSFFWLMSHIWLTYDTGLRDFAISYMPYRLDLLICCLILVVFSMISIFTPIWNKYNTEERKRARQKERENMDAIACLFCFLVGWNPFSDAVFMNIFLLILAVCVIVVCTFC